MKLSERTYLALISSPVLHSLVFLSSASCHCASCHCASCCSVTVPRLWHRPPARPCFLWSLTNAMLDMSSCLALLGPSCCHCPALSSSPGLSCCYSPALSSSTGLSCCTLLCHRPLVCHVVIALLFHRLPWSVMLS